MRSLPYITIALTDDSPWTERSLLHPPQTEYVALDVKRMTKIVTDILTKRHRLNEVYAGRKFEVVCGLEVFEELCDEFQSRRDQLGFDLVLPIELSGPNGLRMRDMPVRVVPGFPGAEVIPCGEPSIRVPPPPRPPVTCRYDGISDTYTFSDGFRLSRVAILAAGSVERLSALLPSDEHRKHFFESHFQWPANWSAMRATIDRVKPARMTATRPCAERTELESFGGLRVKKAKPRRPWRNRVMRWCYKRALWRFHKQEHVPGGKYYLPGKELTLPCAYCRLGRRRRQR